MRTRRARLVGTAVGAAALVATMVGSPAAQATNHQNPDYAHPADVIAFNLEYMPSTVTIEQGASLTFGNYDPNKGIPAHSLDEVVPGCTAPPYTGNNPGGPGCRYPRFSSGLTDHGQVHDFMKGTLVVQ